MKVRDIMTSSVDSIGSTESIARAALLMAQKDVGALPVVDSGKLAGIVTDRDIAVRGVAAGVADSSPVGEIMTRKVAFCSKDDEIDGVLKAMSNEQVRRMPVCGDGNSVVGMVSLADAARRDPDRTEVAGALSEICEPSGLHCQSLERSWATPRSAVGELPDPKVHA